MVSQPPSPLSSSVTTFGPGAQLIPPNQIISKEFVCFQDQFGYLRSGFAYKNGSNYRVVCHERDEQVNRTIPLGKPVLAFNGITTTHGFQGNFSPADFQFTWFDQAAQNQAIAALNTYTLQQQQEQYVKLPLQFSALRI